MATMACVPFRRMCSRCRAVRGWMSMAEQPARVLTTGQWRAPATADDRYLWDADAV